MGPRHVGGEGGASPWFATGALSFGGLIGACLTPFRADGRVDVPALEREIDFLVPDVDALSFAAVEASEYRLPAPRTVTG